MRRHRVLGLGALAAALFTSMIAAGPSSGHGVVVAAETCVYAGPVSYDGQQLVQQIGACVPTP